jgi:hypothetical protein
MTLKFLLAGAALAVGLAGAAAANAQTYILGTEDASSGFVGNLLEGSFPGTHYLVASDGESSFDPFGAGYDTSDGINLSGVGYSWDQAADSIWTSLGNQTWVLPANLSSIGCGVENSTTCEPMGHFISPSAWNPAALGTYVILEAGGGFSDIITTYNDANGFANITFSSDPMPEPSTWAIMMVGVFGMGAALRRRRVKEVAVAA